ncbi:MAG: phosphoribosylanthranilate isomerase [Spirosomataceae bacterium]
MQPRVKICCISSVAEARLAVECGAAALGLVGHMPSGPGIISDELIAQIAGSVPPPISTFLLTCETNADAIIAHHQRVHTTTVQIVDALQEGTYAQIRQALPAVKLVQVIHVIDEKTVEEAIQAAEFVDALLLDSGNPSLQIKELGGTGRVHNWKLSRQIRDSISIPLFLAGGLRAENVKEAMDTVQPFGLDLCSSVRTDGLLDRRKLERFFEAIG